MLRFVLGLVAAGLLSIALIGSPIPSFLSADAGSGCGTAYTIQRGDTLTEIAERVYGKSARYQEIFDANRDRLKDPARITGGDTIFLPCLDTAGAPADRGQTRLAAEVAARLAAPTGTVAEKPADRLDRPLRMVTASSFAPYADVDRHAGGLVTDLAVRALRRAGAGPDARLAFVDDWTVHLKGLGSGGFDLSLPWFRPDCSASETLGAEVRRLCEHFAFSRPLHEVTVAFYALAEGPLAGITDPTGFADRTLCLPSGLPPLMLGREGPLPDGAAMVIAPATTDCLERLMRGEVDAVASTKPEADREIGRLGLGSAVAELEPLTAVRTLHALALKANPAGAARLEALDRGLEVVKQSGEWFRVVSTHNASSARP